MSHHLCIRRAGLAVPKLQHRPSYQTPRTPALITLSIRNHTQLATQKSSWTHPVYTQEQILSVQVAHKNANSLPDKLALGTVRFLRWSMDLVTGYRSTTAKASRTNAMTEKKWITRFIFLESVAGVPGMVAGMLRHLKSLRQMKRDYGWIETLLEEAYNERMHLLTFLNLAEPSRSMRLMVLGSQCVFFSGFSIAYLLSPRICHRFVGYLEEEAVITYSKAIQDLDSGLLPKWEHLQAPPMAVKYWDMPEGRRCMRSLLLYVRADEAKHRDVNHTLGSLDQDLDKNPFSAKFREQVGRVEGVIGERVKV
ncbi:alternative oxidase mitochondrial precursor [Aspergillus campestris IBT 28561]|uniref:Alternative oxidase n=1 Tax=Aspergillus campestris (strain IBT 28561) TaxID=1392248 RepID=A0A2I1CRT5_ASPC2|nr:alternative oxidase mitochondrial precursor [Aspergillus campestris IBT 28561]PKY00325.1 alternative oxidase mitochondrial precursor [Aspergillus campestris IBT 28561]